MMKHGKIDDRTIETIESYVRRGIEIRKEPADYSSDPFWKRLKDVGSELWLDTGDLEAAEGLWTEEFTALTTNNTLLNAEVQKGIYDDVIKEVGSLLSHLEESTRIIEIAFVLNARHGLRLVERFGGKVSVELHTDLAHDIQGTVEYARRFYRIAPRHFIIKVPLTPEGLIATRQLREGDIPVNFTLGFSARHNSIATAFAFPTYVNVFLGRLNAYISDNGLGDGLLVGEKATLSSQRFVKEVSRKNRTLQIAASMRNAAQVDYLAGIDVLTMPVKVASGAKTELSGQWESCLNKDYRVSLHPHIDEKSIRLSTLWEVTEQEKEFARSLVNEAPRDAEELVDRAHEQGVGDLFPHMSAEALSHIEQDGKIPRHSKWEERIKGGQLAIDTLLNLAGLASFEASQGELDDRIRGLIE